MPNSKQGKPDYSKAFFALLFLLVIISAAIRWRLDPVVPLEPKTPADEFSAVRAASVLATVLGDERPHPVDSIAGNEVRKRIISVLEGLAYRVDVQDTTSCRTFWFPTCARVRNIIAVHEGSAEGKAILLSAHYDSVAAGPGASDAGSAVAALLEVARLLKNGPEGTNSVIFLFNEGEEAGLLGSDAFISLHPLAERVAVAINIEARGTTGQSIMFETGDSSGWLVEAFASTSNRPLTNSLLYEAYKLMPNDTDMTVFKANGIQGLNFAHAEQVSYYHTPMDNLEQLDLGSLQQHGDNLHGLVQALQDSDLGTKATEGNRVYTDILGFGVIHWPVSWGLAIASILLGIFIVFAWNIRKSSYYSMSSFALGLTSFLLSLALGGVVAYAITAVLSVLNGMTTPWHSSSLFNRLLLWSSVVLAVISLQKLLSSKVNAVGFWAGVCLPWMLLAVLSSVELPGISYLFILPSAAAVASLLLVPEIGKRISVSLAPMLVTVPAIVAFLVVIPAVFLVEIMVGFNAQVGVIAMGVVIALAITFIGPLAGAASKNNVYKYTCYLLFILIVGSAILSLRAPAYSETQPQPLNVIYLQDSDGRAHVLTGNQYRQPPSPVLEAMGESISLESMLPWTSLRQYNVPADSEGLSPASLSVESERKVSTGREVVARIVAGSPVQKIMIMIPDSAGLSAIAIDGHDINYPAASRAPSGYKVFVCQGESCDGKQIKLTLASDEPQQTLIAKMTAGVPIGVKTIAQSRGTQALPYGDGDRSIILATVSL